MPKKTMQRVPADSRKTKKADNAGAVVALTLDVAELEWSTLSSQFPALYFTSTMSLSFFILYIAC